MLCKLKKKGSKSPNCTALWSLLGHFFYCIVKMICQTSCQAHHMILIYITFYSWFSCPEQNLGLVLKKRFCEAATFPLHKWECVKYVSCARLSWANAWLDDVWLDSEIIENDREMIVSHFTKWCLGSSRCCTFLASY